MANCREHFQHFGTNAIHTGQEPEQWDADQIIPPVSLSTTFKQSEPGKFKKYDYSRASNPSRNTLEKCLAALEGAEYCKCCV
ncbi:unnamed protein product [Litomosoides sigmodontis]|uniref:cystathionine gamma-lyase n=1 Tax=Litomosoides sigmodontis TaxID=42156 RepID=A0A3P6TFC0_LITSI|nr:unnamed protein product [Litomosoides sigmodontis]